MNLALILFDKQILPILFYGSPMWSLPYSYKFMMMSSNGNISALLTICAGNSAVTGKFFEQSQWGGALMFSLICLNKRLSKQWWDWWFETPSRPRPLWRHCNVLYLSNKTDTVDIRGIASRALRSLRRRCAFYFCSTSRKDCSWPTKKPD